MNKNFMDIKRKTFFSMFLIAFLLISANRVDVASASPDTHFYVDPPEVRDVSSPDTFLVNINVTDAPESYGWEVYIRWDPDLIEVVTVGEGDFLHRWDPNPFPPPDYIRKYETTFTHVPTLLPDANAQGEMWIGCSLKGDVPWASGDGWLASLSFRVKAEGSCVLDLFNTRLWDYELGGSAFYTYYPSLDGFFYNTLFHDVAVTSVTASVTEGGELAAVNVTVTNEGNYTETSGTFNVTVYADITAYEYTYDATGQLIRTTVVVGDEIVVGTQSVTEALAIGASATLDFTWDTTDVSGGNYTVSAELKGDDDTRDNLFIDGTVVVAVHDIAITNVVPSATEVNVGDNVTFEVTAENQGHFDENFTVTLYYDNTAIETKTGIVLESGNSTTLTFTWNTTDVAKGTYTIKAAASVVPDEVDTADNTFIDGTVKVGGEAAPDILLYAAIGIVIIVIAAIAVYFIWFRKPT